MMVLLADFGRRMDRGLMRSKHEEEFVLRPFRGIGRRGLQKASCYDRVFQSSPRRSVKKTLS